MRKFRNAALAAATAVTVTFAGVSVAGAQTGENLPSQAEQGSSSASSKQENVGSSVGKTLLEGGSSKAGEVTEADKLVNATDLFGSSVNDENNPLWALLWRDGGTIAAIATALGGVIAAYNYAVYQGIIPHAIQF